MKALLDRALPMSFDVFLPVYVIGHIWLIMVGRRFPHLALAGPVVYLLVCLFFAVLSGLSEKRFSSIALKTIVAVAMSFPLVWIFYR